jgi:DNA gyrase/topoisomerase IV subunit A
MIRNPKITHAELMTYVPGPDFPGGGQIITPQAQIAEMYETGRGSMKVRARWKIEELARGQWQAVVTELPPGTSSAEGAGGNRGADQPEGQARQEGAAAGTADAEAD